MGPSARAGRCPSEGGPRHGAARAEEDQGRQRQGNYDSGKSSAAKPRVRFTIPDAVEGHRVVGSRKKLNQGTAGMFSNVTQLGRKAAEYVWGSIDTILGLAETHLGKQAAQQFIKQPDRKGRRALLSEPNRVEEGKKDYPKWG